MPKKRTKNFHTTKPQNSVHPSLIKSSPIPNHGSSSSSSFISPASHAHSQIASESETSSVNDLINRLRRVQTPSQTQVMMDNPNFHSVPPSLSQLLHLPVTPAPRPRPGDRDSYRNGRSPRAPGLAGPIPKSWFGHPNMLVPVKDAPLLGTDYRHVSGRDPHSFARLPGGFLPEPGTLQHLALKGLAKNWDETSVYYMWYLAELPGWLKEALLCYIACYSPKGISLSSLTTLMLDDGRIPAATNSEDVTRLDLARSSVAGRFNMLDLAEYLLNKPTEASPLHSPSSSFSASNSSLSSASGFSTITPYSRVPDSWDEDSPPPNKMARNGDLIGFIAPCPTLRFPFLTHLSLAYSPNSDWSGLIELSPALRTLTHLSLAGWSQPTGNMFRRPELHELCPKAVGGSCRESCRVVAHDRTSRQIGMFCLRRLSRTLICLKWLDLEGCDWIWMLEPGPPTRQSVARKLDWPERSGEENGIDWCGGWRGLETINRTPTGRTKVPWESIRKYQALFDSREARLKEAQATGMTRNEASALRMLPEAKFRADNDIHLWWAKEREALEVERRIRQRRNALGLKGIFFENGIPPEERALVEKVVNKWEFATDAGVYLPPL